MNKKYQSILIHVDTMHQSTDAYQRFIKNLNYLNTVTDAAEWNPAVDLLEPIEALMEMSDVADDLGVSELFHIQQLQTDSLQSILSSLGVSASTSILFSDSPHSTSIARDLGLKTIGIATQYDTEQFEKADFIMKHFGDEILRQLF